MPTGIEVVGSSASKPGGGPKPPKTVAVAPVPLAELVVAVMDRELATFRQSVCSQLLDRVRAESGVWL